MLNKSAINFLFTTKLWWFNNIVIVLFYCLLVTKANNRAIVLEDMSFRCEFKFTVASRVWLFGHATPLKITKTLLLLLKGTQYAMPKKGRTHYAGLKWRGKQYAGRRDVSPLQISKSDHSFLNIPNSMTWSTSIPCTGTRFITCPKT